MSCDEKIFVPTTWVGLVVGQRSSSNTVHFDACYKSFRFSLFFVEFCAILGCFESNLEYCVMFVLCVACHKCFSFPPLSDNKSDLP
jgi:hypothetical protein